MLHTPPQPVKSKNLVQVSILISLLTFVSQITFKRAVNGLWGSIPRLSLNLAAGLCSGQSWGLTLLCLTSPPSLRRSHSPQKSWYSTIFQGKVSLPVMGVGTGSLMSFPNPNHCGVEKQRWVRPFLVEISAWPLL